MLSVVVPARNEAAHLESSLRAIQGELASLGGEHELIVVDDGSADDTWDVLARLAAADPRVRGLRLSRHFGKEAAICAGLGEARGAAALVMDSDLQHPPALIPEMHRLWKDEGYDLVEAVKQDRGREAVLPYVGARLFYRAFRRLSGIALEGATDFKLMDRRVLDAWARLPERTTFFRGMSAWTGFRRRQVGFAVPPRRAGRSQWTRLELVAYAVDSITSFTALPILFVVLMGALFLVFAAGLGLLAVYYKATGASLAGFPTVILVELIIGSLLLISMGIIGQYIAKIYDEVKGRPRFIVAESTSRGAADGGPSAT
jgi:glycosyltransferase involved in cell wall biosynthesis